MHWNVCVALAEYVPYLVKYHSDKDTEIFETHGDWYSSLKTVT